MANGIDDLQVHIIHSNRKTIAIELKMDSVFVHELCHRKHMNHSAQFYAEVERVFPEYRRCQKWLKENGGLYLSRLP